MQMETQGTMMGNTPPDMLMNGDEIDLRAYWQVLVKRHRLVLAVFLAVLVLVMAVTLAMTPRYKASTQLLVERTERTTIASDHPASGYDPMFLNTQFEIIRSMSVSQRVVDLLKLDTTYRSYFLKDKEKFSLTGAIGAWLKNTVSPWFTSTTTTKAAELEDDTEPIRDVDLISNILAKNLTVKPVRNTNVVDISYMHPNAVMAKRVVNAYARAYMDELMEIRMRHSSYILGWLAVKIEEEQKKLQESEQILQQYMKEHNIVAVENRVAVSPLQLEEFSAKLSDAQAKRKELEGLVRTIRNQRHNPAALENLQLFVDNSVLNNIRERQLLVEKTISDMSKMYGPKHPDLIKAREEQTLLRQEKNRELQRLAEVKISEYELAKQQEENLTQLLEGAKSSALDLNEKLIQYNLIKRDVDTNRILYESMVKYSKERSVTEQIQKVDVTVLEQALTPGAPAKPNIRLNFMLALVLGLFGGVAVAFLVEHLDNTIKSGPELEERFGLPLLGMVPYHKLKDSTITQAVAADSQSVLADSYRMVRAALMLSAAGRSPKVVLITSMGPGDGKSSTALNLARTFVQADKSVLLIDADMRKPRLHALVDVDNSFGLSTYLAGVSDTVPIVKVPRENMQVLTSGPIPPNPSELIDSQRMRALLETLRQHYDIILLDSPPILNLVDALGLSKLADGTLLVVRSGKTTRDYLAGGMAKLRRIDSHLLGAVLNGVRSGRRGGYGSYGGYGKYASYGGSGYGYGYGYGRDKKGGKGSNA